MLFKIKNFCEIDRYAVKSYCAIHGVSEQINLRDVSTVNTSELHDVNLITYGFPCQDISQAGHQKESKEWCDTLCSRDWKDPKCVKVKQVFNIVDNSNGFTNPQRGRVYDTDGLSPCLSTIQGGGREPKILKIGNCNPSVTGCNGDVFSSKGLAATVTTNKGEGQKVAIDEFKIRKLTPLECWRLMGFDDEDFYRAQNAGISNSQLYKQAGNSIVVNVLQAIFRQFDFEKAA